MEYRWCVMDVCQLEHAGRPIFKDTLVRRFQKRWTAVLWCWWWSQWDERWSVRMEVREIT